MTRISVLLCLITAFTVSCSPKVTIGSIIDTNGNHPHIRGVLNNLISNVPAEDSIVIRNIKIGATEASFAVHLNDYSNKILIPDTVNWRDFVVANAKDYHVQMCGFDGECAETLRLYNQVYQVIHKLNHAVNRRYIESNIDSYIRREEPRQIRMSYEEEIRAESFLVAYLEKYEPGMAERLYSVMKDALARNRFTFTSDQVEEKWNAFDFSEYEEMNLTIMYIYVAAYESRDRKDLKAFVRPLKLG